MRTCPRVGGVLLFMVSAPMAGMGLGYAVPRVLAVVMRVDSAPALNPDGTTSAAPVTEHCSWLDLGPSMKPLSPAWWYGQGYGYWTIYAKGRVSLDLRSESGWWLGQWVDDEVWVAPPPRVVSPTGLRDEPWRRYGMALDSWVSGRVLACVRSGSAYTWGEQLTAWGSPYTALPVSRACEAPRVEDCE